MKNGFAFLSNDEFASLVADINAGRRFGDPDCVYWADESWYLFRNGKMISAADLSGSDPSSRTTKGGVDRPIAMGFGNSIMNQARPAANGSNNAVNERSHMFWAMAYAGWPFQFARTGLNRQIGADPQSTLSGGIYGYSGQTSVTISGFFDDVITPYSPSIVFVNCMENDPVFIAGSQANLATVFAAYDSIITQCKAIGALPIWINCLPSFSFNTAQLATDYWAIVGYMETRAAQGDILLVSTVDLYMDCSQTTPVPLNAGSFANNTDASVHPMKTAQIIGKRIADVLALAGFSNIRANSLGPAFDLPGPGNPRFVDGNTTMAGATGTVGGGAAGVVATKCTLSCDMTTATCTGSLPADGSRQYQQVDISTAGAQAGIKNAMQLNTAGTAAGWAVGDYVQGFWEIEIDSATPPVGLRVPWLQLQFATSGGDATVNQQAGADLWNQYMIPNTRILIATPETQVPVGCTSLRLFARFAAANNAASVAARIKTYRFVIVNWSR